MTKNKTNLSGLSVRKKRKEKEGSKQFSTSSVKEITKYFGNSNLENLTTLQKIHVRGCEKVSQLRATRSSQPCNKLASASVSAKESTSKIIITKEAKKQTVEHR